VDVITYRPHKSYAYFTPFALTIALILFLTAGYYLPHMRYTGIILMLFGILSLWLTKSLYDSSNIVILFEQEGLRITGGKAKNYQYLLWKDITYGCYVRNFKGHLFLVLSPGELNPKIAKRLANIGANLSKICVDSSVVVYIDVTQNTSQLTEMVENHILHISSY